MSAPSDQETPARIEPAMKTSSAPIQTRVAPKRRLNQPLRGMTVANASRYTVITH